MDFSAVRQPIYNTKKNKVAYQLSFMNPNQLVNKCIPPVAFQDRSDPRKLYELLAEAGIESYSDSRTMIITFERETLERVLDYFLPARGIVVEISPTEQLDGGLLELVRTGSRRNYNIILGEKALQAGNEPFLPHLSHIKIDVTDKTEDAVKGLVAKARRYKVRIILDNIASDEEFKKYRALNAEFYKGDLFSKQDLAQVRETKLNQGTLLDVFRHVMSENYCYKKLTDILATDSRLTHKLIAFLNSVMYGRAGSISSIKQAICFMGEHKMRKFISLLTAQELTDTRSGDIYFKAASRARFCELLATQMGKQRTVVDRAFLSGLFSNLPDILGLEMEEALELLKIHQEIRNALTGAGGDLNRMVDMVIAYEAADWEALASLTRGSKVSLEQVPKLYQQVLRDMKTETFRIH